ncbi:hypothetical protein [Thalassobacillus sp. CUG 92003]|uniref:hypothetical protein n=1 Tax=Thalassobacillus sp. CUG 92003 TaxID=2736641 RepID=UPI0015E66E96|nr:hypothetical protein [Thalassobacillus sp. CUG 92003]
MKNEEKDQKEERIAPFDQLMFGRPKKENAAETEPSEEKNSAPNLNFDLPNVMQNVSKKWSNISPFFKKLSEFNKGDDSK